MLDEGFSLFLEVLEIPWILFLTQAADFVLSHRLVAHHEIGPQGERAHLER